MLALYHQRLILLQNNVEAIEGEFVSGELLGISQFHSGFQVKVKEMKGEVVHMKMDSLTDALF